MLERFTIDTIVDEIDRRVKGANPDAKLVHRFFRKGRRDGKRQLPVESMRAFVTEAVGLATSKLGQEHLAATEDARRQLAALEARRDQLDAALARPDPTVTQEEPAASDGSAFYGNQPGPIIASARLDDAMDGLRAKRREAKRVASGAQRTANQAELDQVNQQIALAEDELERAPDRFRQLVASSHQVGKLLWARYCVGFDGGKAKRGRPDDADEGPDPDIDFPYPESLERSVQAAAKPRRVPAPAATHRDKEESVV